MRVFQKRSELVSFHKIENYETQNGIDSICLLELVGRLEQAFDDILKEIKELIFSFIFECDYFFF